MQIFPVRLAAGNEARSIGFHSVFCFVTQAGLESVRSAEHGQSEFHNAQPGTSFKPFHPGSPAAMHFFSVKVAETLENRLFSD